MIQLTFSLRLIHHNSSHQSGTGTIRKRNVFPSMSNLILVLFHVRERLHFTHSAFLLKLKLFKSWSNSHGLKVTKLFSPVLCFYHFRSVPRPDLKATSQSQSSNNWMSCTLLKVLSVLKCLRLSANLHTGGSAVDSNGERTLIRLLVYPCLSLTGERLSKAFGLKPVLWLRRTQ